MENEKHFFHEPKNKKAAQSGRLFVARSKM
jgi:hypothetical protein